MEIGMIRQIDIDEEMQQSYLDYAMSVIISRALPDARDGLKPVHRRILHAMHAMGMHPEGAYRKSARIVGEVLGKYHPHGDMAVYDAMARMAQPFSMRYPLVDGQGNFGSVDGDSPAAMRYTEAKLAPISAEIMADLEKDTVPFSDNFDGSLREPTVLPSGTPNMLVNGATGIAVGMSTSIPPHNMGEVCTALIHMLSNWDRLEDISVEELMGFIPGPDFPTGGIIVVQGAESDSIVSAYASGRGKITLQARVHIEEMGRGRSRIIVTELPFQTNKSSLIERIAELARSGSLEGLSDLRDESDREGMRIVLELSKNASPEKILSTLYRRTPMQSTFSIIMLALVEGEPRMLTLKQSVRVFLDHRLEVIKRRSEFDLARAKEREHILAGLRIALKNLDEVIQLIRTAKDSEQASSRLQKSFELSEIQARAILDMPLRRLSGLERRKIESEYKEVLARIKGLESLLRSPKKMRALVASELEEIKSEFGDRRRTQIVAAGRGEQPTPLTASDLAPDKETWVVITKSGQVSRTPTARLPRLSGSSAPVLVVGSNTRDTLYLFDNQGHSCALEVHTIPEVDDPEDGKHYTSITPFSANRLPIAGISIPGEFASQPEGSWFLVLATRKGMIKKTDVRALPGPSAKTFISIKIDAKDELGWVDMSSGTDDLILVSRPGMAIRFPESSVRSTGLSTAGVMGIRLDEGSEVVTMCVVDPAKELLLVTESGEVKRSAVKTFPKQGRNGKGVLAWRSGEDVRIAGGAMGVEKDRAVIRFSRGAPRSLRYGDAPRRARSSSGKLLFEMGESNRIREVVPAVTRVSLERGKSPEAKQASGAPVAKKRKTTRKIATKGQSSKRSGTKTSSTRKQSSGKSKTKPSSKKKS